MDQRRLTRQWLAFALLGLIVAFGSTYYVAWLLAGAFG